MSAPAPRKKPAAKPAPKTVAKPATSARTYTVTDDVLHYTTKGGHELVIDLDFPTDLLQLSMGTDDEDRSEEEQFDVIARSFGDNFDVAYKAMGVLERRRVQRAVFDEFQKAMGIPLGESLRSSRS